jgi:hypothetical protein
MATGKKLKAFILPTLGIRNKGPIFLNSSLMKFSLIYLNLILTILALDSG